MYGIYSRVASVSTDSWSYEGNYLRATFIQDAVFIQGNTVIALFGDHCTIYNVVYTCICTVHIHVYMYVL